MAGVERQRRVVRLHGCRGTSGRLVHPALHLMRAGLPGAQLKGGGEGGAGRMCECGVFEVALPGPPVVHGQDRWNTAGGGEAFPGRGKF